MAQGGSESPTLSPSTQGYAPDELAALRATAAKREILLQGQVGLSDLSSLLSKPLFTLTKLDAASAPAVLSAPTGTLIRPCTCRTLSCERT